LTFCKIDILKFLPLPLLYKFELL